MIILFKSIQPKKNCHCLELLTSLSNRQSRRGVRRVRYMKLFSNESKTDTD